MKNFEPEKVSIDIINWISKYVKDNGIKSLIVGVSGGIDSAVVSNLCAITGIETYLVLLPLHQNPSHTELGEEHINSLSEKYKNVKKLKFDLSNTFDEFSKIFDSETPNKLSLANSKSRLRMMSLYLIAQNKNGVVVGTGNKVEDFGVGFFTKYGDGGVDISPIADIYKSEVYEIAKFLNINSKIINSVPTDGLWEDGRSDEQQLGFKYSEIEWAMKNENTLIYDNLSEKQKIIFDLYKKLNKQNKHKMVEIPKFKLI